MEEKLSFDIPSLDIHDFTNGNPQDKERFVEDLGKGFHDIGFVAVKNHGLNKMLSEELYKAVKSFFDLADIVKEKYNIPGLAGQRGYVGKGKEHAKGRKTGDLKEFFHIGQEVNEDDPLTNSYPPNVWPEEVPELRTFGVKAFEVLEQTGMRILSAIALYLELPEDYFDKKAEKGNSILRPIHYFPITDPNSIPEDAVRAAAHGDINLITLLMGASAEGLQILGKNGQWISVTAKPDQLIVNVGDMLARLTNDRLKSTVHRVVNPPRELMKYPRYSIPFFMHPRAEMDLTCLENCVSDEHPKQYEDITAGEFLQERLREIGLAK